MFTIKFFNFACIHSKTIANNNLSNITDSFKNVYLHVFIGIDNAKISKKNRNAVFTRIILTCRVFPVLLSLYIVKLPVGVENRTYVFLWSFGIFGKIPKMSENICWRGICCRISKN